MRTRTLARSDRGGWHVQGARRHPILRCQQLQFGLCIAIEASGTITISLIDLMREIDSTRAAHFMYLSALLLFLLFSE